MDKENLKDVAICIFSTAVAVGSIVFMIRMVLGI